MSNESWSLELWDQHENVIRSFQEEHATVEKYLSFMKEIQAMHADIAKKYKKTISPYLPKRKQGSDETTVQEAFNKIVNQFNAMSAVHENFSKEIESSIITKLKKANEEMKKKQNKYSKRKIEFQQKIEDQKKKLEVSWNNYYITHKNKLKAHEASEKANKDDTLARVEQNKYRMIYDNKTKEFNDAQVGYATTIKLYNEYQCGFYTKKNVDFIGSIEEDHEKYGLLLKDMIEKLSEVHQTGFEKLTESSTSMKDINSVIDVPKDVENLIMKHRSNMQFPVNMEFLNLVKCPGDLLEGPASRLYNYLVGLPEDSNSNKSSNSHGTLASRFPFNRKKKEELVNVATPFVCNLGAKPVNLTEMTVVQLNRRLGDWAALVTQTEGEIKATTDMLNLYTENPSMGDAKSAQISLAMLQRRQNSLNKLLDQLKDRYAELGGDDACVNMQQKIADTYGDHKNLPSSVSDQTSNDSPRNSVSNEFDSDVDEDSDPVSSSPYMEKREPEPAQPIPGDLQHDLPAHVATATMVYEYEGDGETYLAAKAGDVFYVLEFDTQETGWTAVATADGRQGFIPTSFAEIKDA